MLKIGACRGGEGAYAITRAEPAAVRAQILACAFRRYGSPVGRRCRRHPAHRCGGLGAGVVPVPTPRLWEVPTTSEVMCLCGLDVHQAHTVAAALDPLSASYAWSGCDAASAGVVLAFLEELEGPVRAIL